MGRLQAAGSVSVWTQSINQYLILRLQGDTRHVSLCYDIVRYFRHIQDFGLSVGDRAFIQLLLFFVVYGTTKRSGGNSSIEDVSRSLTSMKHATEADHYQRT